MFLLQKRKGYTSIISRLAYTVIIIFVYSAIYQIRYPGICMDIVKNQADIYFTSVLSSSTRPYMLANIIVNILSIMFNYFKRMKEDGAAGKRIYDVTNLLLMVFISITHSLIGAYVLDKYVVGISRNMFFFYYSVINLISSLFVAWFNRQMMLNGIGYGVYIVLMLQIANMFIITNQVYSISSLFSVLGLNNVICLFSMFCLTSLIERLIVYAPIYIMSSFSTRADESISRMEFKPSNANILANILSTQTINIFYVFSSWLYGQATNGLLYSLMQVGAINSLIFQLNNSKYTSMLIYVVYLVLLFFYNYVYSHINYVNISSPSANLRKSLCHIPNVPLGDMVDRLVNKILVICSVVSVLITFMIFFIPYAMKQLVGYSLNMSGTDIIIVTSSFMYIIDFAKSVYFYNTYRFGGDIIVVKDTAKGRRDEISTSD